jgi:hypothetical protein
LTDAIKDNRFHVFSHPEFRDELAEVFAGFWPNFGIIRLILGLIGVSRSRSGDEPATRKRGRRRAFRTVAAAAREIERGPIAAIGGRMVVTGATSSAGSKGKDNVIANRKAGDALPVRSTMPAPSCPSTTGMRTSSRPSRITISGLRHESAFYVR